jgi:probable rRNA maturation factor
VAVQFACARRGLPSAALFRAWARGAAPGPGTIVIRLVPQAQARALNAAFRGADYAPNVLSFGYGTAPLSGDVVLCPRVVAREAREQGKALAAHWAHMVVHGTLHLLGFDHERARDAKRMEGRERALLARIGVADPYGD